MTITKVEGSSIEIHVLNLAAYTAGRIVGDWVELDDFDDFESFRARVREVTQNAEEVMIGDEENDFGFCLFDEYTDLGTVWRIHAIFADLARLDEVEAFADFLYYEDRVGEISEKVVEEFRDRYHGQWDSLEDFAWYSASDIYSEFFSSVPSGFRVEVDTVAWEQDYWISDNGHVFDRG